MLIPGKGWFPITPRGVAAAAGASWGNLLLKAGLAALGVGLVLLAFLHSNIFPVFTDFLTRIPEGTEVRSGLLVPGENSGGIAAEGKIISFCFEDPNREEGMTSDFRVALGARKGRFCSLLGCLVYHYPSGASYVFRPSETIPRWEAWRPFAGLGFMLLISLVLLLGWFMLGLLYVPVCRLLAFYADREIDTPGAWRVGIASLLPGALWMGLILFLYGLGALDLVRFLFAFLGHFVFGWLYLLSAPFFLERLSSAKAKGNPFS